MEALILCEIQRLKELGLVPTRLLIDALEYQYIKQRHISMVRMSSKAVVPADTFYGLAVTPIINLEGGFQVAVQNHTQGNQYGY